MMTVDFLLGDSTTSLNSLPENCVDCCITSPPYYGLRNYKTQGQIGLEETPDEYIGKLVSVFSQVKRVLKHTGTLWVNIGDSYCNFKNDKGIKNKDLIGIPWMLAFALRSDGWYLRQEIIWSKVNCLPESVTDRCSKSHEQIFLLSKSPHYYFNQEAIKEPMADSSISRLRQNIDKQKGSSRIEAKTNGNMKAVGQKPTIDNIPKRNKRTVWTIKSKGFKGAHFAVYPEKLIEPCVLAGCPVGGIVLDVFAGSGTTGVVSVNNQRNAILCDINPSYINLMQDRIEKERRDR